jgi:dTDP-4-dehydrorhamnose reductase
MKIYLFGSTGMLGRYIYLLLSKYYNVNCINRVDYNIKNDTFEKLEEILSSDLRENDIIINCAGIIPQKYLKDEYKVYIKVNTLFPHKLSEIADKYNLKFIHITTDCVYDGIKGNYSESDLHTAKDIYGISKSLGEPKNTTIIRTSIIGEEITGKKSLIEWIKSNKDGEINGYTNHYWNGVTCLTLATFIKSIIENNNFWKGVKHIYSENIVTKYDLCCYVNEIYNLNIKINKFEDKIQKNMTLTGEIKIEENIFEQIKNQQIKFIY